MQGREKEKKKMPSTNKCVYVFTTSTLSFVFFITMIALIVVESTQDCSAASVLFAICMISTIPALIALCLQKNNKSGYYSIKPFGIVDSSSPDVMAKLISPGLVFHFRGNKKTNVFVN